MPNFKPDPGCLTEGCTRSHSARGLCARCYNRVRDRMVLGLSPPWEVLEGQGKALPLLSRREKNKRMAGKTGEGKQELSREELERRIAEVREEKIKAVRDRGWVDGEE